MITIKDNQISNKQFISQEEGIDVCTSITGNPTHMGHMHMMAAAVNRLVEAGYKINQIRFSLSGEEYLQNKVRLSNVSIEMANGRGEKTEMYKVCLPREKRIKFLQAAIQQAKEIGVFRENIPIVIFDDDNEPSQKSKKIFRICGGDYAVQEGLFNEDKKAQQWVIVTRDGYELKEFSQSHEKNFSKLITKNNDEMNNYSSSKIQNGAYHQLPASIQEEFKSLHIRAQLLEDIKSPVARETAKKILEGGYTNSYGEKILLRTGAQLLEASSFFPNALLKDPVPGNYNTKIKIVNCDCLKAAEYELKKLKNEAKNVAVLMFASPTEPGGGMSDNGDHGQEEELCRRSDIFGFMWDQVISFAKTSFYPLGIDTPHQKNPDYSGMEKNGMIHIPNVTVFRSEKKNEYQFLEKPFKVGMLVSAPLDRPDYERKDGITCYKREEDAEQLRKLIMTQLKVSYDEGYDTLILGSFGCGAFWNPPELIAAVYKEIIDDYFTGAFKKIVFAILEDGRIETHNPEGNLKPFTTFFKEGNSNKRVGFISESFTSKTDEIAEKTESVVVQSVSGSSIIKSTIKELKKGSDNPLKKQIANVSLAVLIVSLGISSWMKPAGPQTVSPLTSITPSGKISLAAVGVFLTLATGAAAYYYRYLTQNSKSKLNVKPINLKGAFNRAVL